MFVIGLYSLALLARGGLAGRAFVAWASLYGLCAVSAAPPLVGLLRDGNLGESAGVFSDLATWIPQLLLPRGGGSGLAVLAGAIYLGVVALGLVARETRLVTAAFLIGPLAVAALAGLAYAQIFKLNIFSTFIMPFFALVAARLLVRLRPARAWVGAGALGTVLCAFSVLFLMNRPPTTGYLAASQLIRSERRAGDVVYVPQPSMFWGMARYMGVERRAWHLEVAPVLTAQWRRMHDRLGAGFVSLFGLEPRTQTLVTREGIELVVGAEPPDAAAARWVWLVTYERADLPAGFPPPAIGELRPTLSTTVGFLHIQRYERVH